MEASTPDGRLIAFGNQLIVIHLRLREELERLRRDADAYLDGHGERLPDLRTHCLAFCSALTRHHTGEDGGAFVVLAERFPGLRSVIEELERDHHIVAEMLRGLEALFGGLGPGADPAEARRVRGELDGLVAVLESHFVFEEKKLLAALDSLDARAATAEDLFGLAR